MSVSYLHVHVFHYFKGYTFNTAEGPKVLKGTIITCLGDNLGSHAMGGFKEGASAERPCRHCMINKKELNVKVRCTNL